MTTASEQLVRGMLSTDGTVGMGDTVELSTGERGKAIHFDGNRVEVRPDRQPKHDPQVTVWARTHELRVVKGRT